MPRINTELGGSTALTTTGQPAQKAVGSLHERAKSKPPSYGDCIFVLIDHSGSMDWEMDHTQRSNFSRLDAAKDAFQLFLQKSNSQREQIGAIAFSSGAEIICEPTNNFIKPEIEVMKLEVHGSTAMGEAMLLALEWPTLSRAILISDGCPDNPEPVEEAIMLAKGKKIPFDTIFIGRVGDNGQELMKKIAEMTGGYYFTVDSLAAFQKTFAMLESTARLQLADQRKR